MRGEECSDSIEDAGDEGRERLAGVQYVDTDIGLELNIVERAFEDLTVLSSGDQRCGHADVAERGDHGRKFQHLWPGTGDHHDRPCLIHVLAPRSRPSNWPAAARTLDERPC